MKAVITVLLASLMLPVHASQNTLESKQVAEGLAKTLDGSEEIVCEKKKVAGSNRVERVCMTKSERIAAKDKAQEDLRRFGRCSGNDVVCVGTP